MRISSGLAVSRIIIALLIVAILVVAVLTLALYSRGKNNPSPSLHSLDHTYFAYLLKNPTEESPVGIASYGISNNSGTLHFYRIDASEVEGIADVSAINAVTNWNYSIYPQYGILSCITCASLQMNVNAVVNTTSGQQIFWIQNTVSFFDTSTDSFLPAHGQIWNLTTIDANMSTGISGNGELGELDNQTDYGFGSFFAPTMSYNLPLSVKLVTSVQMIQNGVQIRLYDSPFGNGTFSPYGVAYMPIGNALSASIVVTPFVTYPWGYPNGLRPTFDSELVWTAYCCAQTTKFTEMDSSLSLSYLNSASGGFVPYPSYYTFGDVIETASNLRVVPIQTGGEVTIGQNNNSFLSSS